MAAAYSTIESVQGDLAARVAMIGSHVPRASAMMLAATRFGCAADLRAELAQSQPNLLAQLRRSVPDMFPKAYRWVAEMQEIADFAGEDAAARDIYQGIARFYQALADDAAADKMKTGQLAAFFEP